MIEEERATIKTFVGATGRKLTVYITDASGVAYNLSGVTTVSIVARDGGEGGTVVLDAVEMDVDNEAGGVVSFTPDATECGTAGKFDCQIWMDSDCTELMWYEVNPSIQGDS